MKTAKGLMLSIIAGSGVQAGALFADDVTLELPYLASIGLPPVTTGPREITKVLNFVDGALYPGFSFEEVGILIDTPDQVLAEYHINHKSVITGVEVPHQVTRNQLDELRLGQPTGDRDRECEWRGSRHLPEQIDADERRSGYLCELHLPVQITEST
jgi:hypothetical protein